MQKPGKRDWLLLVAAAVALIGVLLMVFGRDGADAGAADAQSYDEDTVHRMKQMVRAISGSDDAEILVFSKEARSDGTETSAQTVFGITADSREENRAEIPCGVAVAVPGGSDPDLQQELIAMIHAVFGVGTNRIYIGEKLN